MKSLPKILTIFFLAIFIFQLTCLIFIFVLPKTSQAADPIQFKPQVAIPGYTFASGDKTTGNIANLIRAIYKYAIGIVGILAAVVLMIGGVMWIVAGGSSTMIGEAKSWIGASLTGLVIALSSYLILATVNPALVDLKTTAIQQVTPTAYETKFDPAMPCGQDTSGQQRTCGSQCPAGKTCQKTPKGTPGASECPITLTDNASGGNGDYWICADASEAAKGCCLYDKRVGATMMYGYQDCLNTIKLYCMNNVSGIKEFVENKSCDVTLLTGIWSCK